MSLPTVRIGPISLLLLLLATSSLSVNLASTKISTDRNALRVKICDYYSANFTAQQRQQTQPLI